MGGAQENRRKYAMTLTIETPNMGLLVFANPPGSH